MIHVNTCSKNNPNKKFKCIEYFQGFPFYNLPSPSTPCRECKFQEGENLYLFCYLAHKIVSGGSANKLWVNEGAQSQAGPLQALG